MRRRTLLLAAVAAAAAAAGGLLYPAALPPPQQQQVPEAALPALRANYAAADRIQLVHGADMLWLERRGQTWALSQAGGYPVLPDKAAALVDGLLALRLEHPVDGTAEERGVADPAAAAGGGTLVRVLATSGTVLAAIMLGPASGPGYVRRPGHSTVWLATPHVAASTDPAEWTGSRLPPPDLARLTAAPDATLDTATLRHLLADLRFTAVRAAALVRPAPLRSIPLVLPDGTANLELGQADGQLWLHISGSSAWARRFSPFAFALPPGSLMAGG